MNKENVQKGFKKIFWGIGLCFIAPVVIMQAFKNEGHPMYWPVLAVGIVLARIGGGHCLTFTCHRSWLFRYFDLGIWSFRK